MQNKKLKLKIALTNIRRIITSILFINIMPIYNKFVLWTSSGGVTHVVATCYDTGPQVEIQEKNYFIIVVPIVIVVILIIGLVIGIKKHKKKKMEKENDKKD